MLTSAGCAARRARLWSRLPDDIEWALVTEPAHLVYFANFLPSPFVFNSQGARGVLLLGRDGTSVLIADNVQQPFLDAAHAAEKIAPVWYRCIESARHRGTLLIESVLERLRNATGHRFACEPASCPAGLIDGFRAVRSNLALTDIDPVVRELRRAKDPDEVALIRRSLQAATAGLKAAMSQVHPGMTEFDVYRLVQRVAGEAAGTHVLLYGDFVSGPRCEQGGGPPSDRVVEAGDLLLLDFSAVIHGYRGDFCNTFVCDGRPTSRQRELFDACYAALEAGERTLRAGTRCRDVDAAVRNSLAKRNLADRIPHHTGHGIGLGHPEPPFLVPESSETLIAGDVVTLEPGVYIPGVGGMRYERDYLITANGCESLSDHPIGIEAR
ncbi:MAG TPA: Xaa-Pro peptidase family protein [Planctomycetaceae bacterium]|nr:Xaa-Pro peptidase family protein [Planctomycetaceae bacterium]